MKRIKAFGLFWWDFVIGDDWRIAAGVVAALAVTAGLAHSGLTAWWLLPVAALAMLGISLWSAHRTARAAVPAPDDAPEPASPTQ